MLPLGPCRHDWSVLLSVVKKVSGPELWHWAFSMPLLQPKTVLSISPVTTEGHVNTLCLGYHLRSCWHLRVVLQPGPYRSEWSLLPHSAMVTSRSRLQHRAMPMVLLELEFLLMSISMFPLKVTEKHSV